MLVPRGVWLGRAALEAHALVPRLRGATAEAQAPDAGGGARGLSAEKKVAVSLRRPNVEDDVLGSRSAGEAAVEAGRC